MLGLEGPRECWAPAALRLLRGAKGLRLRKTGVVLREYSGCGSSGAVSCGPGRWPWALLKRNPALHTCLKPASLISNLLATPGNFLSLSLTGYGISNSLTSSSYSSPGGCPLHPYTNTLLSSPCSLSSQPPCFLLAPWSLNFISLAVVEKGRDPALHLDCKPHKVQGMTLAWTITSSFP